MSHPSQQAREYQDQVWYAIPCANFAMAQKTLPIWKAQGYKLALLLDRDKIIPEWMHALADVITTPWEKFKGYAHAANYLIAEVIPASVPIVVIGGDDMYPDRKYRADEIAIEFKRKFSDLFGVMQPTGDTLDGTDRICGSPWLGRAFIEQVNNGRGPIWPDYFHFFEDEELFNVAKLLGCLWQNPNLTHYHEHWSRERIAQPKHIERAQAMWSEDKAIFERRKKTGFPGHERARIGSQS